MEAIEFIRKFGWDKSIEIISGRKSWNDKKSGKLLTDNSYMLENQRYEHAIGTSYMGVFTEYDENSYRIGEVNLLKLKKYIYAYALVQSYGGLHGFKTYCNGDFSENDLKVIALVEEVGILGERDENN